MVIKRSLGDYIFDISNFIVLILLMLVTLYPFLHIVFASISNPSLLAAHSGLILSPLGFNTEAYKVVFENPAIWTGYRNTLIYLVLGTTYNIVMTSMGAYVLSRRNFYWKNFISTLVIITMFFGGGLIPTYLLIKGLGMLDTIWAIIVPGAISTWNLIIMRTYFASIPESLEESAKIEGANDFTILFKIIIPLAMPVIAVMILYYGVGHWNAWFNAVMYLPSANQLHPLQLILRQILINNSTDTMTTAVTDSDKLMVSETIKYATVIVATLPILAAYPFLQKYFVKGVMIGAIKG